MAESPLTKYGITDIPERMNYLHNFTELKSSDLFVGKYILHIYAVQKQFKWVGVEIVRDIQPSRRRLMAYFANRIWKFSINDNQWFNISINTSNTFAMDSDEFIHYLSGNKEDIYLNIPENYIRESYNPNNWNNAQVQLPPIQPQPVQPQPVAESPLIKYGITNIPAELNYMRNFSELKTSELENNKYVMLIISINHKFEGAYVDLVELSHLNGWGSVSVFGWRDNMWEQTTGEHYTDIHARIAQYVHIEFDDLHNNLIEMTYLSIPQNYIQNPNFDVVNPNFNPNEWSIKIAPQLLPLSREKNILMRGDETFHDLIELEDKPIVQYLKETPDAFAIYYDGNWYVSTMSILTPLIQNRSGVFFECKELNTVRPSNIVSDVPLFALNKLGMSIGIVLLNEIKLISPETSKYYILTYPTRNILTTTNYDIVRNPHTTNFVGASHCQEGQGGTLYTIKRLNPIFLADEVAKRVSGAFKRGGTRQRKRRVHKKRTVKLNLYYGLKNRKELEKLTDVE